MNTFPVSWVQNVAALLLFDHSECLHIIAAALQQLHGLLIRFQIMFRVAMIPSNIFCSPW